MTYAILLTCGIVGMVIGFLIGLACNGDVKKLNAKLNDSLDDLDEALDGVDYWTAQYDEAQAEVNRLSDLVATLQAKVPARNARGKFVAR